MTIESEKEIIPRDISEEFLSLPSDQFRELLRELRNEPALSIEIDWVDKIVARKLKAFLEDFSAISRGQQRTAAIRATRAQYAQELNVFESGVKWIEIK